jgi:hypothetical protein
MFFSIRNRVDVCANYKAPSSHFNIKAAWNAFVELRNKGVKTRFITEINKDNILYCKELIKILDELRHLDEIKGNFGIVDGIEYRASPTALEE